MTRDLFATLPGMHTAIAEWIACLICLWPQPRRLKGAKLCLGMIAFFVALSVTNVLRVQQDYLAWVLLMATGMLEMIGMLYTCCRITIWQTLYHWAHALIAAEFAASLEWQINCYIIYGGWHLTVFQTYVCLVIVYALVFSALWFLNRRGELIKNQLYITWREAVSAAMIALSMFFLGNVSFAFRDNFISRSMGLSVLFVRTLSDLCGLVILYANDEQRRELYLQYELEEMNRLFNRQYEQFRQAEINNEALHRIYHDLKHQIAFIRSETDENKRSSYLAEMEHAVSIHEASANTGNSVLDTLLTSKNLACAESGITMTIFADASRLGHMDVMDLCSLFGNALDNAIEYESALDDADKRLIKVTVFNQNQLTLIRIENYCEEEVRLQDGTPMTTKTDRQMHGYGVKSIRRAVEKYGGNVSFTQADGWFCVTALIPSEAA